MKVFLPTSAEEAVGLLGEGVVMAGGTYVMPHFQGQLGWPEASCDWVTGSGGEFVNRAVQAITKSIADHAAEQEAKHHQ